MSLQSTVFGFKDDPALEACAVRDDAHILQGWNDVGGHVLKVQQALTALDGLDISSTELAARRYGSSTANAVLKFKAKRRIINFGYQTQADNIVGKMTIKAMDQELARRFPFQPIDRLDIPPDLPVPPLPSGSPTSTHFKIRFLGGISGAGEGLAGDVLFFQIWDTTNNLAQVFSYYGAGVGAGLPKILPPLSATLAGPFTEFLTVKPVPVGTFCGPAHWTSVGGGPFTLNILQVFGVVDLAGVQMFVNTGLTVGIGGSSSVGLMQPQSAAGPFSGI